MDAIVDIMDSYGWGPNLKWVDDLNNFRMPTGRDPSGDWIYGHGLADIFRLAARLGIPWHATKTTDWMTFHKNLRRFCSKSSLAEFDLTRVSWALVHQTLAGSSSSVFLCQPLSAPNLVRPDGNRICNGCDCLSRLAESVSEVKRGLQLLLQSTEGGTPPP